MFPEGTRSTDGWLQRFRHGTSRLAIEMHMPVVPIAIVGAYAAMPKGRSWPKPGRPRSASGTARRCTRQDGETHQQLSLRMQQAVAELFDEDRTTWFEAQPARRRRARRPSSPAPKAPAGCAPGRGSRPIRRSGKPPTWR